MASTTKVFAAPTQQQAVLPIYRVPSDIWHKNIFPLLTPKELEPFSSCAAAFRKVFVEYLHTAEGNAYFLSRFKLLQIRDDLSFATQFFQALNATNNSRFGIQFRSSFTIPVNFVLDARSGKVDMLKFERSPTVNAVCKRAFGGISCDVSRSAEGNIASAYSFALHREVDFDPFGNVHFIDQSLSIKGRLEYAQTYYAENHPHQAEEYLQGLPEFMQNHLQERFGDKNNAERAHEIGAYLFKAFPQRPDMPDLFPTAPPDIQWIDEDEKEIAVSEERQTYIRQNRLLLTLLDALDVDPSAYQMALSNLETQFPDLVKQMGWDLADLHLDKNLVRTYRENYGLLLLRSDEEAGLTLATLTQLHGHRKHVILMALAKIDEPREPAVPKPSTFDGS